ncbi:MAG: hypothetical protein ACUVQY_03325, partial [Thermoproteota archaeon]
FLVAVGGMLSRGLGVLAVGAHPNDVEFIAGGTLAFPKGFKIHIATICTGDMSSMTFNLGGDYEC